MIGEIINFEVFLIVIDLPKPFSLGFGTLKSLPRVFIQLTAQGEDKLVVGFGEASIDFPFVSYDAWDVIWALKSIQLVGRNVEHREKILSDHHIREKLLRFPAAFAAVNMALDDVAGRYFKKPLVDFYGGGCRVSGQALESLPFFDSGKDCIENLDLPVSNSIKVKLKAGQGVRKDAQIISEACQFLEKRGAFCAIDFNAFYSLADFEALIDLLTRNNMPWSTVLFLEQPTIYETGIEGLIKASSLLTSRDIFTPIMIDEAFDSMTEAAAANANGILLNFKIQKIGGIVVAREIEAALKNRTLRSMVGATFPTAVGRSYDQHAATVLRSASLPSNAWMPSTNYFYGQKHLIRETFEQNADGSYSAPSGPGLGVNVIECLLKQYHVDDPLAEYQKIRNDCDGTRLTIQLRNAKSYKSEYERLSGRDIDWNFGALSL